ncbi:tetratricopeptide repeat protein [Rubripirellula amarantea]|nr:tetratricopeptide repeat protein [Rubripirellula amarantea]
MKSNVIAADHQSAPASSYDRNHRFRWAFGAIVLAMVIAAVYGSTLNAPLIFDDEVTLIQNTSIHTLWPLVGHSPDFGPLHPTAGTPVSARPLVNLTFAINYHFHQLDPRGYRVVNMVIHGSVAILVWVLVTRTLRLRKFGTRFDSSANLIGFLSAIVWAVHPINTETVVYITQRTELMVGLFYVATLLFSSCYFTAESLRSKATYLFLAVLASVVGMLSKEMMASVPAVVFVYQRIFFDDRCWSMLKKSWKLYVGLALTWIPVALLYAYGFRTPGGGFDEGVAIHHWWLSQSPVVFLYWRMSVWPWPLLIHYQFPVVTDFAAVWPWVTANVLLILLSVWGFVKRWPVAFVTVAFYAILSPTLLIPLPMEPAVERRMYLPLAVIVPFGIAGSYWILDVLRPRLSNHVHESKVLRLLVVVFVVAIASVFAVISKRRLTLYHNQLALWQDTLLHQPENTIALYGAGTLLALQGNVEEAVPYFEKSYRIDPTYYKSGYNLAQAYDRLGKNNEAIEQYQRTLEIKPTDPATHLNLGRLFEFEGDSEQAITHYREAISASPDFALARTNLGLLLLSQGQVAGAIKQLEMALRLDEDLPQYMNLVLAYSQAGKNEDVLRLLQSASDLARERGDIAVAEKLENARRQLAR